MGTNTAPLTLDVLSAGSRSVRRRALGPSGKPARWGITTARLRPARCPIGDARQITVGGYPYQ
ncbi:hypothetical protein FHU30_007423 [Actinomadura rupiterrae]|nr:hypothetical protein [Actinomadura rupiterrae]